MILDWLIHHSQPAGGGTPSTTGGGTATGGAAAASHPSVAIGTALGIGAAHSKRMFQGS